MTREDLQHTEGKGGAADTAAGEAERGTRDGQDMDASIEPLQVIARFVRIHARVGQRARAICPVQFFEFLLEDIKQGQRLRRGAILSGAAGTPACWIAADRPPLRPRNNQQRYGKERRSSTRSLLW